MKADRQAPIGVFDSGVGGLTVVREIMRNLPDERIVYFGDTARVPYGSIEEHRHPLFPSDRTLSGNPAGQGNRHRLQHRKCAGTRYDRKRD